MKMKTTTFIQCLFLFIQVSLSASESLPSWNEGVAKQKIIEFVKATCDPVNPNYVPPENRIATFDQDGTLWVEHPLNPQAFFELDRVKSLSLLNPPWKNEEPFRAIIHNDNQAITKFNQQDWERIITTTLSGISTESFLTLVKQWLKTAKHPRFQKPYPELVYQPMLELMEYLRENSFKTYIVTAGGQEFVRAYSQCTYGISSEHVIGSSFATQYTYQEGKPLLIILPKVFFLDNRAGKAIGINLFIGKRPCAAFGNSDGDREMLEWTQAGGGLRLMMLVHHDDAEREYAYGPAGDLPDTHKGRFSEKLLNESIEKGWIIISMKRDWKHIFSRKPQ
jgi:hypothetical protein